METLFYDFDRNDLSYCLWKSFDRWGDSLEGKTDIDLLLDGSDRERALELLSEHGWIPLKAESWRSFDRVYDFIKLHNGRWLHLHLHEIIVTGEKLIKSFRPPLNEFYFSNSQSLPFPIHVAPEVEFVLFILRLSLKLTWIDYARVVRRRSFTSIYRDFRWEYEDLRGRCNERRLRSILECSGLDWVNADIILKAFESLDAVKWHHRWQLRQDIAPHRQGNPLSRFLKIQKRKYFRSREKTGKTLYSKGLSIALCGHDGAGKTSLCDKLEKRLAEHLKVTRFYMGGNQNSGDFRRWFVMSCLWLPYLLIRKTFKILHWSKWVHWIEVLYQGIDVKLMEREKCTRFAKAQNCLKCNSLVLFERFPLFPGYGDQLSDAMKLPAPDLVFMVLTDEETALSRRSDEAEQVIREKVAAFHSYAVNKKGEPGFYIFDGMDDMEGNVQRALGLIEQSILENG